MAWVGSGYTLGLGWDDRSNGSNHPGWGTCIKAVRMGLYLLSLLSLDLVVFLLLFISVISNTHIRYMSRRDAQAHRLGYSVGCIDNVFLHRTKLDTS